MVVASVGGTTDLSPSRTELDSHANMAVVGRHSFVIEDTGRTADVNPFTPDYHALENIPIVNAALLYECPFSGQEVILVVMDALYVESMDHNLIPPFLLREAGIHINDIPKIHLEDPGENDHAICFKDFRIPLKLNGIFSYFNSSKPTEEQVRDLDNLYLLTPTGKWDPHNSVYSTNEDAMLDWEGNIKTTSTKVKIVLEDIQEDPAVSAAMLIGAIEAHAIDRRFCGAAGNLARPRRPKCSPDSKSVRK